MQAGDGRDTRFRVESLAGIALIGTLVSIYMASQTLRNSIGVIAPDLARDLDLSAAQLGILSSIFFVGFVAMQIPLGLALDRFGPKRCMIACTGVVIIGTGLFALAPTAGALIAARALIGVGSSCYLMAPLAFYARRFPPERFALLAGVQMGLGTVGTLLATAPLAFSATAFGWRATFWLIAGVMAAGGLLVALVVPGDRSAPLAPPEPLSRSLAGTLQAIRLPYVTALFMMQLAAYSTFALIVGLWGGPYLTHVYGYGLVERGDLLFIAAGGQVIGLLANGPLERRIGGYKTVVVLGALASAALLLVLAATGSLPRGLLVAWLFAFGLASAFTPALIAHGKAQFPAALTGRGLTWLNMGSMGGVFLTQFVSGWIINQFPAEAGGAYPLTAYRLVFALQAAFILMMLVPYGLGKSQAERQFSLQNK